MVDALREMLTVARELRCPVEISHLKGIGWRNWGHTVPEMLRLLENARAEGLDVACDVYPYSAGSTQLIHVLPPEFQKGGLDALTAALRDPGSRAAMRGRMETGSDFENITHLVGFENVVPISLHTEEYKPFEGKSLAEIADTLGKDPYDALFDLLAAERCEAGMIDFIAAEEDIEAILRAPFSVPISDATYPVEGCATRACTAARRAFSRIISASAASSRCRRPCTSSRCSPPTGSVFPARDASPSARTPTCACSRRKISGRTAPTPLRGSLPRAWTPCSSRAYRRSWTGSLPARHGDACCGHTNERSFFRRKL